MYMTVAALNPSSSRDPSYMEALLYVHQVEAIEAANHKARKAFDFIDRQAGGGLHSLLLTTPPSSLALYSPPKKRSRPQSMMLHIADEPGANPLRQSLADDLSDLDDDENDDSIRHHDDDDSDDSDESISHSLREEPPAPRDFHDSGSSSNNSPFNISRGETHPTQAKRQRPSELGNASYQELQDEVIRLRETVQMCYRSLVSVTQNADVKVQKLELQVLYLERKLEDEKTITSKLSISNQSLRKELQEVFRQAKDANDQTKCRKMVQLHQRELTVEKHLNSLLVARNQAVKQNTALKRMLLQTCPDCRSELPLKNAMRQPAHDSTRPALEPSGPSLMTTPSTTNVSRENTTTADRFRANSL
jgi:hypothetical protein